MAGVWVATGIVTVIFFVLLGVTVALLLSRGDVVEPAPSLGDGRSGVSETDSPTATPGPDDVVLDSDAGVTTFQSPSGNIGCAMVSADDDPAYVRCDIGDVTWSVPRPGDCDLDWGGGENGVGVLSVAVDGEAAPVCAGDTIRDQDAQVVAYGQAIWLGEELVCRSAETGMRCESLRSGNGFEVSRGELDIF